MKTRFAALLALLAFTTPATADITALVAIEPTLHEDGVIVARSCHEAGLSKLLGQSVTITITSDLTDAMRSTRSGGYEVFVAPAQVVASALAHGYELMGSTDPEDQYLLVGKASMNSAADLRKARIYLPQQDSIYTYLARGLLTANGLSFKDLSKVEFGRYPQAGLAAITIRASEATVIRSSDWTAWQKEKENVGMAKILATSGAVPGGLSVAIKKDLSPEVRNQLTKWFATSSRSCGMKPVLQRADLSHYKKVAELGTFTPTSLAGVKVVDAEDVKRLIAQGAAIIDTRTEKEFKQKHIPGAVSIPYHEKSLKDVVYESSLDDFSGLKALNVNRPTIFHCNGAECWKSYKASRAAIAAGFTSVYWYRGGMPNWESTGQQIAKE